MIYLRHTTEAQELHIPISDGKGKGTMTLSLKNTTDLAKEIEVVADISASHLYYFLAITLPEDVRVGEYQYTLKDDHIILSQGLLIVGDYGTNETQYNTEITYEQYTD